MLMKTNGCGSGKVTELTKNSSAIKVSNLHKSYGDVRAVDGVNFEVKEEEVFGLLGPNGAGKTTTIEIIEGYRKPDSGGVSVLGFHPIRDGYELKERIGIMLQSTTLYPDLKVGETLKVFAGYYRRSVDTNSLLETIGLKDKKNAYVQELSGGQKRKLVFILSLINDPKLIFLDEPTEGLDPQTRRVVWEIIRKAPKKGKTVFVTTHYIEEAQNLCDRVAIIDYGKIIALDTPKRLMASLEVEQKIEFVTDSAIDMDQLGKIKGVSKAAQIRGDEFVIYTKRVQTTLKELMILAEKEGYEFGGLRVVGATLEDVFMKLTGRRIRE
jgi:ABC-2 type transport system ATP-binding protein